MLNSILGNGVKILHNRVFIPTEVRIAEKTNNHNLTLDGCFIMLMEGGPTGGGWLRFCTLDV